MTMNQLMNDTVNPINRSKKVSYKSKNNILDKESMSYLLQRELFLYDERIGEVPDYLKMNPNKITQQVNLCELYDKSQLVGNPISSSINLYRNNEDTTSDKDNLWDKMNQRTNGVLELFFSSFDKSHFAITGGFLLSFMRNVECNANDIDVMYNRGEKTTKSDFEKIIRTLSSPEMFDKFDDLECYIERSRESNVKKIKSLITHKGQKYTIELYSVPSFDRSVLQHHVAPVRMYYLMGSNRVVMFPSCYFALTTGISFDYRWTSNNTDLSVILKKYTSRGFAFLFMDSYKRRVAELCLEE